MLLIILFSFTWGLAEGLWFFIVPDVGLSFIALKGATKALFATLAVAVGAMFAAVIFSFGTHYSPAFADTLKHFWSLIPGYYPIMFEVAGDHLKASGASGFLSGPTSGIPYRFYLYEAFQQNISLDSVLIYTPLARLERIILAPLGVLTLRFALNKLNQKFAWTSEIALKRVLGYTIIIYWIGIYVWYWGYFLPNTYGGGN